jgi:hypothetical protein
MKWSIFLIFCLLLLSKVADADSTSKYELAIDALDKGDCQKALSLLKEYKIENEVKLKAYKEFETLLDEQISKCSNQVDWNNIRIPEDHTKMEAYQRPPSEIRFQIFSEKEVKG